MASAIYVVWNVLQLDGLDPRPMHLQSRREVLVRLNEGAPDGQVMAETFEDGPCPIRIGGLRNAFKL